MFCALSKPLAGACSSCWCQGPPWSLQEQVGSASSCSGTHLSCRAASIGSPSWQQHSHHRSAGTAATAGGWQQRHIDGVSSRIDDAAPSAVI